MMTKRQRKIKNMKDYEDALVEVSLLWDSPIDTDDGKRLLKLTKMIEEFEDKKFLKFTKTEKEIL